MLAHLPLCKQFCYVFSQSHHLLFLHVVRAANDCMTNISNLNTTINDLEQYQRRYSIRIKNIPYIKGESEADLKTKVVDVLSKAGVQVKG